MGRSGKKGEKKPVVDSGSLLKFWFNPGKVFRTRNIKLKDEGTTVVVGSGTHTGPQTTAFVNAGMKRLLYFSYRSCFPKLPNGSTSDARWGCLIRTTQMLLGTAMMRYHNDGQALLPQDSITQLKKEVSVLFMDLPSAPIGIHKVEDAAHANGLKYARMLCPSEAAAAFGAVLTQCYEEGGDIPFPVCCAERHIDVPKVRSTLEEGKHVLLLIPVVLGIAPLSPQYQKMLLRFLDMKSSCGVAGGFKAASLYLFGHQGQSTFFLDPHYVQTAYTSEKSAGSLIGARGNLMVRHIDPCMIIGFYLHTVEDLTAFLEELAAVNALVSFPLITVSRGGTAAVASNDAAPAASDDNVNAEEDAVSCSSSSRGEPEGGKVEEEKMEENKKEEEGALMASNPLSAKPPQMAAQSA